jgi:hypothetical protein
MQLSEKEVEKEIKEKTEKGMKDVEELKAVLGTVSEEIPKMIRGIIDSFFSPESGARMGKAVAEFYKSLKDAGIPEQEALAMAKDYLGTLTKWSDMLKNMSFGGNKIEVRKEKKEEEKEE